MAKIVLVGNANFDRIWWLDRPLIPGGRLSCEHIETRFGGGGFNTGSALLNLGHEVSLIATLADDAQGHNYLRALAEFGFDTQFITFSPGETMPAEILVEPDGERTIISRGAARKRGMPRIPVVDAALIYLNASPLNPEALETLDCYPQVISQFPLPAGERRPADVMIASRSDIRGETHTVWSDAVTHAGPRLGRLILTNGANPIRIIDQQGQNLVAVPPARPARDTTGAGDYFAAGYIDGVVRGLTPEASVLNGCETAISRLAGRSAATPERQAVPK